MYRTLLLSDESVFAARRSVPAEILFLRMFYPTDEESMRSLLRQGFALLIMRQSSTPPDVQTAIEAVARHTQAGTCHGWLAHWWLGGQGPLISDEEVAVARDRGVSLQAHLHTLLQQRDQAVQLVLVDVRRKGISPDMVRTMQCLNHHLAAWSSWHGLRSCLCDRGQPDLLRGVLSMGKRKGWKWTMLSIVGGASSILLSIYLWRRGMVGWAGFATGMALMFPFFSFLLHVWVRAYTRYQRWHERGKCPSPVPTRAVSALYDAWYTIPRMSLLLTVLAYPWFVGFAWHIWPSFCLSILGISLTVGGFFVLMRLLERWLVVLLPTYRQWWALLFFRRTARIALDNHPKNT